MTEMPQKPPTVKVLKSIAPSLKTAKEVMSYLMQGKFDPTDSRHLATLKEATHGA